MKILVPLLAALVLIVGVAGVAQAGIEAPPGALGATKPGTFVKDPFLDTIGPTGYLLFENQKNQLTCAIPVKSVQTQQATVDFKTDPYGCRNDDATKLLIVRLGPLGPSSNGLRDNNPNPLFIEVNDDSSCRGGHPSSRITIAAYGSYTVPSFQTRVNLGGVQVSGTIGQIDGKVSCVRLTRFA
jgi:hypothetical protein